MWSEPHLMLGSTGSVVCWVCFALVISLLMVLCIGVQILCTVSAVSVFGVLVVHCFVEACSNVLKVCGRRICGNWTYPIAFACNLPSIIGPGVLVTLKTVGNTLLSMWRCRTHDPRLCIDCPP